MTTTMEQRSESRRGAFRKLYVISSCCVTTVLLLTLFFFFIGAVVFEADWVRKAVVDLDFRIREWNEDVERRKGEASIRRPLVENERSVIADQREPDLDRMTTVAAAPTRV